MEMLHVYGDESCCSGGLKYASLGGIAVQQAKVGELNERLQKVKDHYGVTKEVKWTRISRGMLDFYRSYVDVFFDASAVDDMHFWSMYVDSHTFNHRKFNQGQVDVGFSKLFYQLLLHKFGRNYGEAHRIGVYLDFRSSKDDPDMMRPMLNNDLKNWGVHTSPFKRIEFRDSKKCNFIQLNDVLLGVIGFKKNLHDKRPECSPAKIDLANHIIRRAISNESPHRLNSRQARRFAVWPFSFYEKRVSSRV